MALVFFRVFLSYLAGSFPTSIILGNIMKGIDIREFGSGNAGGTNAIRVLGWKAGVFVAFMDGLKGYLAVTILSQLPLPLPHTISVATTSLLTPIQIQVLCGLFAIVGHIWTIFASFRGGKGIATAAGVFLAFSPVAFASLLGLFLTLALLTRYVSLSSLIVLSAAPLLFWLLDSFHLQKMPVETMILAVLLIPLVFYTHRENVKRLWHGTENKLFKPKSVSTSAPESTSEPASESSNSPSEP